MFWFIKIYFVFILLMYISTESDTQMEKNQVYLLIIY